MTGAALVQHEPLVRGFAFVALVATLAAAERAWPGRGDARPAHRQLVNLAFFALDVIVVRLVFPVVGIMVAARVHAAGIGLFPALAWPPALEVVLAALALDCVIYWQHRLLHRVPLLWRTHRVHHSDLAFDVTLGVRFHPFEIALSQLVKFGAIAVLGASPLAVLLFELGLQAGALFTHTDVVLPPRLEGWARRLVVTPSLHRVHHSVERDETDSNFGFSVVWWDRLFGTYRARPRRSETTMPLGLDDFRTSADQRLPALLAQPLRPAVREGARA
jgi:sterol desaturase/sphingolipid hydroxylase (fatty acid hydroxylase superfamily)